MDEGKGALERLFYAGSSAEADAAVAALLRAGCRWKPLGGREANFGLVNIGSDPAVALIERITNAIDAVIDGAARDVDAATIATWESPRDAVTTLFSVSEGRLSSSERPALDSLAASITIAIHDGKRVPRPTIEVRDLGAGIAPAAMPRTILDLAGSNKIDKLHLAGAYGQGGSTTFAFSTGGTLIASSAGDGALGVTFVRFRELDPRRNKNGRYDYLVAANGKIGVLDATTLGFERGTLVRHFDYELPRHHGPASGTTGLLGLVRASLFDPVLPLTLVDRRGLFGSAAGNATTFSGAHAELDAAARDGLAQRQALNLPFGRRAQHGTIAVHYWLLNADDDRGNLRPDPSHSVLVTNFGQTHDAWDQRFVVDALKLPFLKNALVVQVELDALSAGAKRQLLSSTRDRLKRGTLHRDLVDAVRDALLDEALLQEANVERRRRLLREQHAADQHKLQKRFAELMQKFHPGADPAARAHQNGKSRDGTVTEAGVASSEEGPDAEPLATLPHPTYVRIATRTQPIAIQSGRTASIRVESDAPNGYCVHYALARLIPAPDPPAALETVRVSDFRGGRARCVVRAAGAPGITGSLSIRLTTADGRVLADTAPFEVIEAPPVEEPADPTGRKHVRLPRIFPVLRNRWPELSFDETSVAHVSESRDDYSIFVNMDNQHITRLLESVPYQDTGLARMRGTYLVQAAFYAFLLHEQREHFTALSAVELDAYQRLELDRVARTVVTSISSVERIDSASLVDAP